MARNSLGSSKVARDILKRPYARVILPEQSGNYFGEIVEFPGCFSAGSTAAEALGNLEEVAESWLILELEKGHSIPQPIEHSDFSGRLVLRIPRTLHKKAAWAAEREGVSLNQFIASSLSEAVGERRFQFQSAPVLSVVGAVGYQPAFMQSVGSGMASVGTGVATAFTYQLQPLE